MGEVTQLTRLFANLIDNALHYTPADGAIAVRLVSTASDLEASVQDTGIGISREQLPHLFQWARGAGLGLAIAQRIAKVHGGKTTVTSQLGAGSCFTPHLPMARSSD